MLRTSIRRFKPATLLFNLIHAINEEIDLVTRKKLSFIYRNKLLFSIREVPAYEAEMKCRRS